MAKLTLEIEEEYPYLMLGISATTTNYRLCWNINKVLSFNLTRQPDITLSSPKEMPQDFGIFTYFDKVLGISYRLIENRLGHKRFLPEVSKADYLFVVDDRGEELMEGLIADIKSIRAVLMVFPIDMETLKNKQNLMLLA